MKLKLSLAILAGRDSTNLFRLFDSIKDLSKLPTEIIVIYDIKNSEKPTELPQVEGCSLKEIPYYGSGNQPHMRNIAIKHAEGEYIWFIDDDVSLEKDSVKQLITTLEDIEEFGSIGAISGRIIEDNIEWTKKASRKPILWTLKGPIGFFNFDKANFPYELYNCIKSRKQEKYPIIPFLQGTNMVFCKDKLIEIGGFDEDLGAGYATYEDSEPCLALQRLGYLTIFSGNFSLTHHKLLRVGGGNRGYSDDPYSISLIRNHFLSSFKNRYPSRISVVFFSLVYSLSFIPRIIRYNNGSKIDLKTFSIIFRSIIVVFKGLLQGVKSLIDSKSKRINTSNTK